MVVIIDDRADVWEWSPNLVKVIPCEYGYDRGMLCVTEMRLIDDFFVGIGDINSAFLPKVQPLTPVIPPPPTTADPSGPEPTPAALDADDDDESDESEDLLESEAPSSPAVEDEFAELAKDEMLTRNTLALEAQFEERPLAKEQEKLEKTAEEVVDNSEQQSSEAEPAQNGDASSDAEKREKPVRKALLKNDDIELTRVRKVRRIPLSHTDIHLSGTIRSWNSYTNSSTLHTPRKMKTRLPRRSRRSTMSKYVLKNITISPAQY